MEVGASGSYGAQDRSPNATGKMWFAGVDYQIHTRHADLKAQYLKGRAPGDPTHDVYGLELHGDGYVELDGFLMSHLGLLARAEHRDAFVWLGDPDPLGPGNRASHPEERRATRGGPNHLPHPITPNAGDPPNPG